MSSTVKYVLPQLDIGEGDISYDKNKSIIDANLVTNTFLMDLDTIKDDDYTKWAYRTNADNEFFNTSLGGHIALCYPYSFTRLADIPRVGLLKGRPDIADDLESINLGYGRYHAEAFSANAHPRILMLEFGVPKFRSMFSFYTTAVDFKASVIANEGRSPFLYDMAKIGGTAASLILFPFRAGVLYLAKYAFKTVFGDNDTRYYHMKPTMHQYLQSAQNILTIMLTQRGLISIQAGDGSNDKYGVPAKLDTKALEGLKEIIPEVFNSAGSLDIFKIVARPQLIARQYINSIDSMLRSGDVKIPIINEPDVKDLQEYTKSLAKEKLTSYTVDLDDKGREVLDQTIPTPDTATTINPNETDTSDLHTRFPQDKTTYASELIKYMKVTSDFGFDYVGFYVDYIGSNTTTFTNSTKDIPAKGMMNSVGSNFRDMRFNLNGGNILGDAVDEIVKGARDVVVGAADGFTGGLTNVIMALAGGGFIKYPKMWDNSSVDLPTHTFKIHLGGPYGNDISRAMDMDVPLSLLLASVLPQSIGNESYSSPFLCKAFLRGIMDSDMGMVTALSIVAGEGDLGRDKYGAPMSLEVSITITDFADIAVAPTNTGKLGAYQNTLDDFNPLTQYLRTMAGRSYVESRYITKNAKFRATVLEDGIKKMFTPAAVSAFVRDTFVGDLLSILKTENSVAKLWEN